MSTRSTFTPRPPKLYHSPAPSQSLGVSSPQPNTSTRISTPRSRHAPANNMPPAEHEGKTGLSTLPRKRNNGRKRADARKPRGNQTPDTPGTGVDGGSEVDGAVDTADEDSEELFQLLGVAPHEGPSQEKGLLRLSKQDMNAATKKKRTRTKNKGNDHTEEGSEPASAVRNNLVNDANGVSSEPDPAQRTTRQRAKKGAKANKASAQADLSTSPTKADPAPRRKSKPSRAQIPVDPASDSSFDVSAMSKSLPASFFGNKEGDTQTADGLSGWEMPGDAPAGAQPLNWQQQLTAEETPSKRSSRSNDSRRRSKANPRANGHDRHSSVDPQPTSNLTTMMNATYSPAGTKNYAQPKYPISTFDSNIKFHTGFNVHRAPQTPVRTSANTRGSPVPMSGSADIISLPIVGDFPRINKASGAPLGGPKYAGPTFHNSPASASLPKPDLDDF